MSLDPELRFFDRPAPFDLDDDYRGERRRPNGGMHRAQRGGLPWRRPRVRLALVLRTAVTTLAFLVVALLPGALVLARR